MSKKLLAALILIGSFAGSPVKSFSQAGGDYIVHTIKHGEVPSVLAKKYNVSLADLISLNKWGPKVILHAGDKVKLPVGAHLSTGADSASTAPAVVVPPTNTSGTPSTPAEELEGHSAAAAPIIPSPLVPKADTSHYIIHIIQHGEIPSVLAKKYNISVEEVKRINNWTPKVIWHVGDKVKLPRSPVVATNPDSGKITPPTVAKVTTPAVSIKTPVVDTAIKTADATPTGIQGTYIVQKKETLYSIGKKFKVSANQIKTWNKLPNNNIAEGQTLILYTTQPIPQPAATVPTEPATPVKQEPAPVAAPPVVENKPVAAPPVAVQKPIADPAAANVPDEGYFATLFGKDIINKNLQAANGLAMTFKTASGWTDKKYYVLMNDASPGSIVKITNAEGKFVYAKVLWNMGDARDNDGLNFRISDAAAAVLGLKDAKFPITVSFYK